MSARPLSHNNTTQLYGNLSLAAIATSQGAASPW